MGEVREILADQSARGARALLELRPQFGTPEAIVAQVEAQRPAGYRIVGSFDDADEDAAAVAGFRVGESLAWGRYLYVDDLVTSESMRGRGHADAVMSWVEDEARRLRCDQLHLDSGVGPERADAHRFYFRHRLRIASYHFVRGLGEGG